MSDVALVLSREKPWCVERADCIAFLDALPADSVDLVFGSPPYEKARLYLEGGRDLGIARDTNSWVDWMVAVYQAAPRPCKGLVAFVVEGQARDYRWSASPALLMAELHRAGVHLRKPPIYRRIGIPGSGGKDWLRNDYEFIVCATRGGRLPWSDNTAMGRPPRWAPGGSMSHRPADGSRVNEDPWGKRGRGNNLGGRRRDGSKLTGNRRGATSGYRNGDTSNEGLYRPPAIANPGNVIAATAGGGHMGNKLSHANEAPFPESLAEFFVRSFCPPGGVVCDPFSGSGTTGAVAIRHGRRFIGCDLRQSQVDLSRRRIGGETPPLFVDEKGAS